MNIVLIYESQDAAFEHQCAHFVSLLANQSILFHLVLLDSLGH